ncbi:MAG: TonB-dependent receptor [Chitinophagaceae bacterium]|nr:TonB-dependent receptor [Chitinophagaceae bacterium]
METKNQRATFSATANFRPIPHLEIQTAINYTWRNIEKNGIESLSPGGGKAVIYPYARLVDENRNAIPLLKDYRMPFIDTAGAGRLLDWKYNPLDELKLADNATITKAVLLRLNIKYNINRSLSLIINTQLQDDNSQQHSYRSIKTYSTRNLINRYTQLNGATLKNNIPLGGILDNNSGHTLGYAVRSQLNYNNTWKKIYRLNAIAGAEIRQTHFTGENFRAYGYDDNLLTFSQVDYINAVQLYGNFGSSSIPAYQGYDDVTNRFVSLYTNLIGSINDRYTFSASARKDASNLFGVNTNHKWTPLWSTGAAWNMSTEKFYKWKALSSLRLRFTYGYSGNIDNSTTSLPIIGYRSGISPTFIRYAVLSTAWNPDLRWEKIRTINWGIDFLVKNNRLSGSIEYYRKKATDLLSPTPVDPTLGLPGNIVTRNVAILNSNGVDIKLNSKLINKALRLDIALLFAYNRNKIEKYLNESANKGGRVGYGYVITPIEGNDPYALISYKFWGSIHKQATPSEW